MSFYKKTSNDTDFRRKWDSSEYIKKAADGTLIKEKANQKKRPFSSLGFTCEPCGCTFSCSQALSDHKATKSHLKLTGKATGNFGDEKKKATADSIKEKLAQLKEKKNLPPSPVQQSQQSKKKEDSAKKDLESPLNEEISELTEHGFDFTSFQSKKHKF